MSAHSAPPAVRLVATGVALPGREVAGCLVSNEQLASHCEEASMRARAAGAERAILPCSATFPEQRVGVLERRILDGELGVSDLAVAAAKDALARLEGAVDPARIKVVIVATVSELSPAPALATIVAGAVGSSPETLAFDLVVGCSGFLAALEAATALLQRHDPGSLALVVGAEAMSRVLEVTDRTTAPIFGDGGGAVVLERTSGFSGIDWVDTTVFPHQGPRIRIEPLPESHGIVQRLVSLRGEAVVRTDTASRLAVVMDGRAVFRDMVRMLPGLVHEALERRGLGLDDFDRIAFHQANARLVEAVVQALDIPSERLLMNIAGVGNTTSASIPLLLHESAAEGALRAGERVLLVGFGTGYCVGITSLSWS